MKHMTLKEIAAAVGGVYYGSDADYYKGVSSVVIDSRLVEKDSLFVAIRGARVDGHMFILQAIKSGALCALSEKRIENTSYPYILVVSCVQALKALAEHYRKGLDVKVVGITGSVGKTSTKEMMASVFQQKFSVLKTQGNFNNEIGLPLTIFRIKEEHQIAVLEMGISNFGDMNYLAQMARPDFCVLTNIGYAHIEQLKTRDGILKEKSSMLNFMNPKGEIFLNGDDDKLITIQSHGDILPTFYGLNPDFPFYAKDINDQGLDGTTATYVTPKSSFSAHIHVPGKFMVYNALAAIATGYSLGMTEDEIIKGIETLQPIAGRSNLIKTKAYTIIDDCYNASPTSVAAALDLLSHANTRKVAILGDMLELGEKEQNLHFDVGIAVAGHHIDVLVCIGPLSKFIYQGAKHHGIENAYHFADNAAFFADMELILNPDDTVLVKASNGMRFAHIVEKLNFCE
ncbi:MAG: UDP-N-acetylmuramoyl-tripeptide--D-alanyl-D-alanine ligase [Lachnospiraceae bacterium]|nr:UDP-N-acetylmuramoyl-tripeptide--D-alanyl-D-alanine ligase [Lachnospiraceae bacterium]